MFAVAYDCAPNGAPIAAAFFGFVGLVVAGFVGSALSPALCRLYRAANEVEVRVPASVGRLGFALRLAAAWAVESVRAFRCRVSESYFRECCARRAAAEVHSGLTFVEEWGEVLDEDVRCGYIPASVRLALREDMRRYRPSVKAVERARRSAGRPRLWFKFAKVR